MDLLEFIVAADLLDFVGLELDVLEDDALLGDRANRRSAVDVAAKVARRGRGQLLPRVISSKAWRGVAPQRPECGVLWYTSTASRMKILASWSFFAAFHRGTGRICYSETFPQYALITLARWVDIGQPAAVVVEEAVGWRRRLKEEGVKRHVRVSSHQTRW